MSAKAGAATCKAPDGSTKPAPKKACANLGAKAKAPKAKLHSAAVKGMQVALIAAAADTAEAAAPNETAGETAAAAAKPRAQARALKQLATDPLDRIRLDRGAGAALRAFLFSSSRDAPDV